MIKILITDGMDKTAVTDLKTQGYEVTEKFYETNILGNQLKKFDVVVIRSATKIRKEHLNIANQGNLKLIIRAGVGIDNIDHQYAKSIGIDVKNTPNASSHSVAELAMAHMFSLSRFLPASKSSMSMGEWNKKQYKGIEIMGKTLGVIGLGRIGLELAKLGLALNMKVLYNDINESPYATNNMQFVDRKTLLKESDFISLHLPKLDKPVLNMDDFKQMKDTSYIINCARGGVLDENEILQALNENIIAGYGVDVYEEEPTKNIKLVSNNKVSVTPHIGAQTKEAQKRVGQEVVSVINNYFTENQKTI